MTISIIIATLLLVNAILHLMQGPLFGFNQNTTPVFIWGIGLVGLAVMWFSPPVATWVNWVTLIAPLIGGIGLASGIMPSTNPKWLDYSIIVLDIVTVALVAYEMFGG